jgi:hypothetical protein
MNLSKLKSGLRLQLSKLVTHLVSKRKAESTRVLFDPAYFSSINGLAFSLLKYAQLLNKEKSEEFSALRLLPGENKKLKKTSKQLNEVI